MTKEKTVEIGKCIVNHVYSGYIERVTYCGMPSLDAFAITHETFFLKDNPDYGGIIPHRVADTIFTPEHREQLFFPKNYDRTISFPSRSKIEFKVKNVNPLNLTAMVEAD